MPLYEYLCGSCGHRFERIQKFSDAPISECPACGARQVEKLMSSPAIQFKGSGWYITDYAKSGATKSTESAKEGKSPAGESAPAASGESAAKPASPSPSGSSDSGSPAKAPAKADAK